jgi:predicted ATPase
MVKHNVKSQWRQQFKSGGNSLVKHTAVITEPWLCLQVPLGANGCAYFPFEDLCDRPLGAADYFGLFSK